MENELSKGFTGIEVNGVRFSNIGEMLRYMNKQREQLIKAKEVLQLFLKSKNMLQLENACKQAEQFLKEVEK